MPDQGVEARVNYGTAAEALNAQTPWTRVDSAEPATFVINDLQPDTRYFYQVVYRTQQGAPSVTRPTYSFHTQRRKGSGFTFVIQADPHMDEQSDSSVYLRTIRRTS